MEPDGRTFVAITSVTNGVAHVMDGHIMFSPLSGFEGTARITFTFQDSTGATKTGELYLNVNDAAVPPDATTPPPDGGTTTPPPDDGHMHDHDCATPDDPAIAKEHDAAMALVPVSAATHVAVKSGSWFDPTTWANGQVPGDHAKVLIPEGVTVAYDGSSPASIFTIRVDGELSFSPDKSTFLEVDTMVVTCDGTLRIGTEGHPVDPNVQTVIQIAQNGPIDVAWDPMLLSRGIVSLGTVDIHGAEKENFIEVATDPMKGDTSLLLSSAPDGWRVGDKLVITGTHLTNPGNVGDDLPRTGTTEDEVLTIVKIEGNRIYFDKPLQYNHESPPGRDDLNAYVANYTRNIRIQTEGGDATPVSQRGHVMFMHSVDALLRRDRAFERHPDDKRARALRVAHSSRGRHRSVGPRDDRRQRGLGFARMGFRSARFERHPCQQRSL
jgi:hypothetical protein